MSKINAATLEAKMVTRGKCLITITRVSNTFSMKYRLGEIPRNDAIIEAALARAAEGDPFHWVKAWNGR